MMATVYLTDGFDRLPFPAQIVEFGLRGGWRAVGEASWCWDGDSIVTVAGWEVELHASARQRGHYSIDAMIIEPRQRVNLATQPSVVRSAGPICYRCKGPRGREQGKHCESCLAALRAPCVRCGGPKPPGKARRLCESCEPIQYTPKKRRACAKCGAEKPAGRGNRYCSDCAQLALDVLEARRSAWHRKSVPRKPCRGCGRAGSFRTPKGTVTPYCAACQRERAKPATCQRCKQRPVRGPKMKLCVECKAEARRAALAYQEQYRIDHPDRRTRSGRASAQTRRMSKRLKADREGKVIRMADPIMDKGRRVDADLFPKLASAPMVAALDRLFARQHNPWVPRLKDARGKLLPLPGRKELMERLGASERAVLRWRNGENIAFDMADRILQAAGWNWFDVYEPCPGDQQHMQDVTLWGSCPRCEAYCAAEDAFTSTETAADRVGGQLRLEAA